MWVTTHQTTTSEVLQVYFQAGSTEQLNSHSSAFIETNTANILGHRLHFSVDMSCETEARGTNWASWQKMLLERDVFRPYWNFYIIIYKFYLVTELWLSVFSAHIVLWLGLFEFSIRNERIKFAFGSSNDVHCDAQ